MPHIHVQTYWCPSTYCTSVPLETNNDDTCEVWEKKPKPRTHAMSVHMEMQIEKKNTLNHYLGGLTWVCWSSPSMPLRLLVSQIAVSRGETLPLPKGFKTIESSSSRCCDNNWAESSSRPSKASALCLQDLTSQPWPCCWCTLWLTCVFCWLFTMPTGDTDTTSTSEPWWGRSSREPKSIFLWSGSMSVFAAWNATSPMPL